MMLFLLYGCIGAFLRRWYGGVLNDKKILGNRGVQTVVMLAVFLSIYAPYGNLSKWQAWIIPVIVCCWLQFQYWSRGHGCCFDISHYPVEEYIKRYNERWYHIPCDKLIPESNRYGMLYDFLYMALRYTCPMIPMMLIDWRYILIGLAISPVYTIFWYIYDRDKWFYDKCPAWCNSPTNFGEVVGGFITYGGCASLSLGGL